MKDKKHIFLVDTKNFECFPVISSACENAWRNIGVVIGTGGELSIFEA